MITVNRGVQLGMSSSSSYIKISNIFRATKPSCTVAYTYNVETDIKKGSNTGTSVLL